MKINKQKRLGQVFLKDQDIVQKIIQAAEIKSKDQILEIGPGKGVLTEPLLQTGAKITAIEKDPEMINFLQEKFKDNSQLILIQADIRDFLQNQESKNLKFKIKNYKVIGNIPYYLTSHLLRILLENPIKPSLIVLMLQKEVAQRIIAQPPKMNLLSVCVQFYAKPEIIIYVPRTVFWPKPEVDSAVIKIIPINTNENTDKMQIKTFFNVVKAGFRQPRKVLLNNIYYNLNIEKNKIKEIFEQLNIPINARPQNLSVQNWISLAQKLAFFLVN
ncbi:MAG: 16S rRNA (adenine(1518)-N(6)/adenine(1519)-N(6))-dimethyltransferase RsmA [Candidatus Paceibacterota bacterium]|jgi:16S rRNA (adenine1518-N6/adenine1519-N6)-dimethyltransferase